MKVKLQGLIKRYREKCVLNIENYEFKSGKIYAILGSNGAGKTTMLRTIAGVEKATEGFVYYDGKTVVDYNRVSYMPQQTYLFDRTVIENVALGLDKSLHSKEKVMKALEYVGMERYSNINTLKLSGGESQRVAIARLLVRDRDLILMDEPSSSTDIAGNRLLADYIKRVNDHSSSTIIFVTHNPALAIKVAHECIFMENGKILESGSSNEMINLPKSEEMKAFLENWKI